MIGIIGPIDGSYFGGPEGFSVEPRPMTNCWALSFAITYARIQLTRSMMHGKTLSSGQGPSHE
jgi:hypothetical protein